MPHISILLYENALCSSISLPVEMLSAAEEIARTRQKNYSPLVIDIAAETDTINTFGHLRLLPNRRLESIKKTDVIILPAIWRSPHRSRPSLPKLLPWLKKHQASHKTLICAVGSSSNFLAEAGLLDGKVATTHWHDFDRFSQKHPQVELQRNHLITSSENIFCAGTVNSVADLMTYFVAQLYDQDIAKRVERHFSPEIRKPIEQLIYTQGEQAPHNDEEVVQAQSFLQDHYNQSINIDQLAQTIGISVRSLNRRFRQATGLTPIQYLQKLRIQIAEDLLKNSNLSLAEISAHVGYNDYSYFAELFKKWMSSSPKVYRQAVRAKLFHTHSQFD